MNPMSAAFEHRAKAQRVMQAMLKMKKIVVADLLAAHAG
jgi:predicted 3-demethylubiquinone-9 3-methyltransferase (glyoxalase superfamily)